MGAATGLRVAGVALVLCAAVASGAKRVGHAEHARRFHALKQEIHRLDPKEAMRRLTELRGEDTDPPPHQDKIDHFVVLLMENHAFDNTFGCMEIPGVDGIPADGLKIYKDPSDPSAGSVTVTCGKVPYVCPKGPSYDLFDLQFAKGEGSKYPYGEQNLSNAYNNGIASGGTTISMFGKGTLPVKENVASEFGVFNKLYTAVPSASQPNHMFVQSATSCGATGNELWPSCGGPTAQYPQMTMYDSMYVNNVSFALYLNSTCGIDGNPPCNGDFGGTPSIHTPDVSMAGVARHSDRFLSQQLFYEAAASGTLPSFSWLMPPDQACDHPCHDMAKGERYLKDIYEALRAGPKWDKTLFFVVYDDAGGYFDHMPSPTGVPADNSPCSLEGKCLDHFDFRRVGARSTAFMMSPWVGKGTVFQRPTGPYNDSEFEETSVPATIKTLFNLSGFLTDRDRWAGTFDELLLDTPRTDTPQFLPEAPAPTGNWTPPPTPKWKTTTATPHVYNTGTTDGDYIPQHCSLKDQTCHGPDAMTAKQRRLVELFSLLTSTPMPNIATMSNYEASVYIRHRWGEWIKAQQQK